MPVKIDSRQKKAVAFAGDCPVVLQLNLVKRKWMLALLFELFSQPKSRFSDLQRALNPVSPKILSMRLKELERHSLIERLDKKGEYGVTPRGSSMRELVSLLKRQAKACGGAVKCESCVNAGRCAAIYGI